MPWIKSSLRDFLPNRSAYLKPHVRDTPTVAAEILERIKPVEVVDDDAADLVRFGEAEVDGDAAAVVPARSGRPPIGDAAAGRAEMKADAAAPAGIDLRRAGDGDRLAFVTIGPQHPIATTDGAVAGGGGLRDALEAPFDRPAMTGPANHLSPPEASPVLLE